MWCWIKSRQYELIDWSKLYESEEDALANKPSGDGKYASDRWVLIDNPEWWGLTI